ncbi:hypothetical protein [Methylobacterium sp. E-046]|uniref:hypothetical protein n=1 Tax=Methylobacterium sp. E-046 TaxID=2836576 RepID=UPI001FBBE081|nr:hypothetical protein [Methylobacterium sp. E-046]MCJ2102487.1 hypothetical protein [Methylobacterium sp. E-046]
MLADEGDTTAYSGALNTDIHLPTEWISSLVTFIASALPAWRDDPARRAESGETKLSAQLCARLNSVCRHTPGWDFIQFRREEPDETDGRRSIDLIAGAAGIVIWITGRSYNEYQSLIPIECKRLPVPASPDRDQREYLISNISTTGGVQRFKAGHHGAAHERAAMIGYVQEHDVSHWHTTLSQWIDDIVATPVVGWSKADKFTMSDHDVVSRVATLTSVHDRKPGMKPIKIDHLWIEM